MIHNLLHVAEDIRETGPLWTSWAFFVERYCGSLIPAIKSRLHPYGAIDHQIKRLAQVNHLESVFGLQFEPHRPPEELRRGEFHYHDIHECKSW